MSFVDERSSGSIIYFITLNNSNNKFLAEKMLKKHRQTSHLVDKLHKGFVITCIAATIYGLAIAGHRSYLYLTVTKPAREAEELRRLKTEELTKDRETLTG